MTYLVDTNVLSELSKPLPNEGVARWSRAVRRIQLSAVTVEEVVYGLSWKPKPRVLDWFDGFVERHCTVVSITPEISRTAGRLRGRLQSAGQTRTQADMLIAATAIVHGLTLVTRNTRDFDGCGVILLDPFTL